jgi:hypothetical protein
MAENQAPEPELDISNLYHEEMFTDRRVGAIQRLTPITAEGEIDSSRETLYLGQTQVMTSAGPMPLNFEIPGTTLAEAADGFGKAATQAIDETATKLQEMRREQSSQLIVPGQGGGGGGIQGI